MIPSSWFRRLVLALFILEVAGALMWFAARLAPDTDKALAETIAGMVFLLGFYSSAPLSAHFLAPKETEDLVMQKRLASVVERMPRACPVFLYDHEQQNANTVGVLARHSRVYITSGLMRVLSDEGLKGILAHEDGHVQEHHILVVLIYACTYALIAHVAEDHNLFIFGFLAFMTLRRHLEYRADASAGKLVGSAAIVTGLKELSTVYPTKRISRWFIFAMAYPTLPMRIKALETGRQQLF
jgi:heat shock protein HtpX